MPQGLKPSLLWLFAARLKRMRKKSLLRIESCPQRLKPDLFSISYVRAEARTLQKPEFFRSLLSPEALNEFTAQSKTVFLALLQKIGCPMRLPRVKHLFFCGRARNTRLVHSRVCRREEFVIVQ